MKFTETDVLNVFQQIQEFSELRLTIRRVFSGTNFVSIVSGESQGTRKKAVFREFGISPLIDSRRERLVFETASNSGVGPKLLLQTSEYRIEEFLEGRTMERSECGKFLKPTAEALVEFHSIGLELNSQKDSITEYLEDWRVKFIENLSRFLPDRRISELLQAIDSSYCEVLSLSRMDDLLEATSLQSGYVLCHNDFSYGNLIVQEDKVRLIDFEYSGPGHPSTDLASFIIETMFDFSQPEYQFLPQDELPVEDQQQFVFHYCQLRSLDFEDMWKKVQRSKIVLCFLAALWAGCNFSTEKASMIDYAFIRLELFKKYKNELA